jgi:hypothetical protein
MNWVVGQRVSRADDRTQLGTVAQVSPTEIKVAWDDGGVSFHQLGAPFSLMLAT